MTQMLFDQEELLKFRELVIDDVKTSSNTEVFEYLHASPDLWLYVLQTLRREVELQLSCQNAKVKMDLYALSNTEDSSDLSDEYNKQNQIIDVKTKHHKWRMSVLKFLTNIENKTLYVKMYISNQNTNIT
jgi:hypothetical protein